MSEMEEEIRKLRTKLEATSHIATQQQAPVTNILLSPEVLQVLLG